MIPTPVLLSGESPRAEEPGYSPWGRRESDSTSCLERVVVDVTHAQPPESLPSSQDEREAPCLSPQPTCAHRALPPLSQVFAQWGLLPVLCAHLEDHSSPSQQLGLQASLGLSCFSPGDVPSIPIPHRGQPHG